MSDVANVCREIEEFYRQTEEQISDVSDLYNKAKVGADTFSAIRTVGPSLFLEAILNATYALDIRLSIDTIARIVKHLEYVDFLMKVVDQQFTNPIELANQFNQIVEYLHNSHKWYDFLMDLGKMLTKSNFQNSQMKRIAIDVARSLVIGENDVKTVGETALKELLMKDDSNMFAKVQTLKFNSVQLKALKKVLNEYFGDHLIVTCSNNKSKMTAKGDVVRTSDVIKNPCFAEAKYITIIALNTLIIDEDVDKSEQEARISIIAPTWNILLRRKIDLIGKNGENHREASAPNGKGGGLSADGADGKPGWPGGSGGHFLAIASIFINEQYLTIQLSGGNGGAGQHGGNGL